MNKAKANYIKHDQIATTREPLLNVATMVQMYGVIPLQSITIKTLPSINKTYGEVNLTKRASGAPLGMV